MSDDGPRVLLIETSGREGLVALASGAEILAERRLGEGRRNASDLAPAVAELLTQQGWTARQLDAVAVSRGPGSYTGLRVGLMSAKTLAYATGCALVAIDTFSVIANQAPADCSLVDVLADAQKDRVYAQPFRREDAGWVPANALAIVPFTAWRAGRDPRARVTGPGLVKWLAEVPPDAALSDALWHPGAASLLGLALERLQAGERDDPFTVEPLYLRASSAEEQWDRRGQKG